ncbi:PadR family transcriptional regulator [Phyllobacterium salinisoli]|uniref:PadR family transcriptional regulator n=1 Tax=Phyllobacterium salinisoli TaxID=1899321 RepID=A0A368K2L5_9HYPH|nr:PadR family transcriptional regulator [Phyllobacterium salinisoli]RCS22220.1 PadR family transcriptional regulator [Phyllobacterium salinisoli]
MHGYGCHHGERHFGPRGFSGQISRALGRGMGGGFGRFVGDGELRLVVLALLEDAPRHGYDVIKALEEHSSGFYTPSPGVIYPTLTYLEETGHAVSAADGNKKVYSITTDGRSYLEQNRKVAEAALERIRRIGERLARARQWFDGSEGREHDRDIPEVVPEVNEARRALKGALAHRLHAAPPTQRKIADILRKAAEEIQALPQDPDDIDLG